MTHAAVWFGFLLTGVVTTMAGPLIPVFKSAYTLDEGAVALLFPAQFVLATAGALASGPLVRLYGYRQVLLLGYTLLAAGVAGLMIPVWSGILLAVSGYGFALGLVIPSTNLMVAESEGGRAAAALNLLNLSWGAGAVVGPILLELLILSGGVPRVGQALAVALLAVLLVLHRRLPETRSRAGNAGGTDAGATAGGFRNHFGAPVVLTALVLFVYVGIENTLSGWMPLHAQATHDAEGPWRAGPQTAFWGALLLGRLVAPLLLRRYTAERIVGYATAGAAGAILTILLAPGLPLMVAGAALSGAALSMLFPNIVACFIASDPARARSRGALVFAISGVGGAVLPWIAGALSRASESTDPALLVATASAVMMALLWRSLRLRLGTHGA